LSEADVGRRSGDGASVPPSGIGGGTLAPSPQQKGREYTRRNLLLGAGLFVAALLAWGATGLYARSGAGNSVVVTDSEKKKHRFSLDEDSTHVIQTSLGFNTVRIAEGKVCVESADCPNQNCVQQGAISEPGQTVVCLPHKLVIAIEASVDSDADTSDEQPDGAEPGSAGGGVAPEGDGAGETGGSDPPVDSIAG
jgi:hypothetical protein